MTRQILPRNSKTHKTNRTKKQKRTQKIVKLGTKLGAKALSSTGLLKKGLGVRVKAKNSDIGKKNL